MIERVVKYKALWT